MSNKSCRNATFGNEKNRSTANCVPFTLSSTTQLNSTEHIKKLSQTQIIKLAKITVHYIPK